ncbi:MAG: DUF1934 family protein [Bacilli bacterium]|nr:DUF1934 family protein [Bacilli bacterium]
MSKIFLKTKLKSKNENHEFSGKAIKNKNIITYNDNKVITKIIMDKIISIERNSDEYLKLSFQEGKKLKGKYITKYGELEIETNTKKLEKNKITYDLYINEHFIDTFTYNFEYSIDS